MNNDHIKHLTAKDIEKIAIYFLFIIIAGFILHNWSSLNNISNSIKLFHMHQRCFEVIRDGSDVYLYTGAGKIYYCRNFNQNCEEAGKYKPAYE